MATKLFLRNTAANAIGNFYDMLPVAGAAAATGIVNTAASGTQIQWTRTAAGTVLEWVSGRVPAGGFTLTGTMSFSIWAQESNAQANCGARARVFKRTSGGVETEVIGGPYNDGVEFGTSAAEMTWTGLPTATMFAEDDRIVVRYYITNVGTMGSGRTCTITYNAADAATGDSFFQINENVTFKAESIVAEADAAATATSTAASLAAAFLLAVASVAGVATPSGAAAALALTSGATTALASGQSVSGIVAQAEGSAAGLAAISGSSQTFIGTNGQTAATALASGVSGAKVASAGSANGAAATAAVAGARLGAAASSAGSSQGTGASAAKVSASASSAGLSSPSASSALKIPSVAQGQSSTAVQGESETLGTPVIVVDADGAASGAATALADTVTVMKVGTDAAGSGAASASAETVTAIKVGADAVVVGQSSAVAVSALRIASVAVSAGSTSSAIQPGTGASPTDANAAGNTTTAIDAMVAPQSVRAARLHEIGPRRPLRTQGDGE